MYVLIGLIVVIGIVFMIPEKSETPPIDNTEKPVETDITFTTTDTNISLKKGETKEINYTLSGNYNINWFSSNNSVATVSNGIITATGSGTANITGTVSVDGKVKSISVRVTVEKEEEDTPPPEPSKPQIEKLVIASNKLTVTIDESKKIEYRIEPADGEIKSLKWESADTSIATVDENGNVKGIKEGSTTITININDTLIGKITVKVKPKITGLTLNSQSSITLKVGDTSQISAVTEPKDSGVKISYKSNNNNISVNDKGVITGVSSGNSVVTITADKFTKTVNVTVRPKTGVVDGTGVWAYTDSKVVNPVRAYTSFFSNLASKGIGKISGNIYTYSKYTYDIEKSILSADGVNSLVRFYYPQGRDLSTTNIFTFIGGSGERNWGGFFTRLDQDTSLIKSGGIVIIVSARSSYSYKDAVNATEFFKAIVKQQSGVKNSVAGYSMGGPEAGKAMLYSNFNQVFIVCSYIDSNVLDQLKDKEIWFYSPVGDSMARHTKTTLNNIKTKGGFKSVTVVTNNSELINNYSSSVLIVNPGSAQGNGHGWINFVNGNLYAFANKD